MQTETRLFPQAGSPEEIARILAPIFEQQGWTWGVDGPDRLEVPNEDRIIASLRRGIVEAIVSREIVYFGGTGRLMFHRHPELGLTVYLEVGQIDLEWSDEVDDEE